MKHSPTLPLLLLASASLLAACAENSRTNESDKQVSTDPKTTEAKTEPKPEAYLSVTFDAHESGLYKTETIKQDWRDLKWDKIDGRGQIVETASADHGKALEILYPKGSVGPYEGGSQFVVNLPPAEEYALEYDFMMLDGFDFRKGGKMPGLTSGGSRYTGGHKPDEGEGWSARFMWKEEGKLILYLYSVGMKGKWGDVHYLKTAPVEPGKWYTIKQRIRINTPGQEDGSIVAWVNGEEVLHLENLLLRKAPKGKIDTFYFSTFHGGNTPDWGPENDCRMLYDNFRITE